MYGTPNDTNGPYSDYREYKVLNGELTEEVMEERIHHWLNNPKQKVEETVKKIKGTNNVCAITTREYYNVSNCVTGAGIVDTDYKDGITHNVLQTAIAQVITMEEWKEKGKPRGTFWVYDIDGWAYWANPILPGEATGLLLNGINMKWFPDEPWSYRMYVEGQYATAGDWGDPKEKTGFYEDGMTEDGLSVLEVAAEMIPTITSIKVQGGPIQFVKAGETVELKAEINIDNATGTTDETAVEWTCKLKDTGEDRTDKCIGEMGNRFTSYNRWDEYDKTYIITATSKYDRTKQASAEFYIYSRSVDNVVKGADGKFYMDYGDNTFRQLKWDAQGKIYPLEEYICAGADGIIGNEDDKEVYVSGVSVEYGEWISNWPNSYRKYRSDKFIPTANPNVFYAMGDKRQLGKRGEDGVIDGFKIWISQPGISTSASLEPYDYEELSDMPYDYEELSSKGVDGIRTVEIDNIEWFVLMKNKEEALLVSRRYLPGEFYYFGNDASDTELKTWENSNVRSKLQSWLNKQKTLSRIAIEKEINTRTSDTYQKDAAEAEWKTTKDKIFILTEADYLGTQWGKVTTNPRDYTFGDKKFVPKGFSSENWQKTWLRMPQGEYRRFLDDYGSGKEETQGSFRSPLSVRPALWVKMPSQDNTTSSQP